MERTIVELTARSRRTFYEPLLLILALQQIRRRQFYAPESGLLDRRGSTAPSEADFATDGSSNAGDDVSLHSFINKLAKTCDSSRGGDTVTGLAITQRPDGVVYVFGSNNRNEDQLLDVKAFVQRLLETIQKAPEHNPSTREQKSQHRAVWNNVFGQILRFHRDRIRIYLRQLSSSLKACLRLCEGHGSAEDAILKGGLEPLQTLVEECQKVDDGSGSDEYVAQIETLIQAMYRHVRNSKDQSGATMVGLVRQRLERGGNDWAEFNHFAGRIAAYHQTVSVLVGARRHWADLFENFEIIMVPSSTPIKKPIEKNAITADIIIGHMTSDAEDIAKYRAIAKTLQPLYLDEEIQRQRRNKKWKPIVHSEVLVHSWLENSPEGLRSDRFYDGQKYIGTSKPSCALCACYFSQHGSDVRTRASHSTYYNNWRVPDLFDNQGRGPMQTRDRIMRGLTEHVRRHIMSLLDEKVPAGRRYDTETSTTYPDGFGVASSFPTSSWGSATPSVAASIDNLTESLGKLSTGTASRAGSDSS